MSSRLPTDDDFARIADLADHIHGEIHLECTDHDIIVSAAVSILARALHDRALKSEDPPLALMKLRNSAHVGLDIMIEAWDTGQALGYKTWSSVNPHTRKQS